jgi:hypothetical protein
MALQDDGEIGNSVSVLVEQNDRIVALIEFADFAGCTRERFAADECLAPALLRSILPMP